MSVRTGIYDCGRATAKSAGSLAPLSCDTIRRMTNKATRADPDCPYHVRLHPDEKCTCANGVPAIVSPCIYRSEKGVCPMKREEHNAASWVYGYPAHSYVAAAPPLWPHDECIERIVALIARAEQAERDVDTAKTNLLYSLAYNESQRKLTIVQLSELVLRFQQLQHAAMHDSIADRAKALTAKEDAETRIAELTRENERLRAAWKPGRWFRIYAADGTLWMETSDETEAVEEAQEKRLPLERLWVATGEEWREVATEERT